MTHPDPYNATPEYSIETFDRFVLAHDNAGRWGATDERGALNLITAEKRVQAARLVRTGDIVSLSRPISTQRTASNPVPAEQSVWTDDRGSAEHLGFAFHGFGFTHIDALCHSWADNLLYNGFTPDDCFSGNNGASHLDINVWGEGIVTRAVLLDVPAHRGTAFVEQGAPVTGDELQQICDAQGIEVTPGDAVIIYSGRDAYDSSHDRTWAALDAPRPGVHPSAIEFLSKTDAAVLVWDMLEEGPYDTQFTVHAAIFHLGMALIDNAELGQLATICRAQHRTDFQLTIAPLRVVGGTGSPVNPIALL